MNPRAREEADLSAGHPAVLAVVCSALFFGVVNGSAVAVVLPEIGADLNIAAGDLSWVLSGFLLAYGVAIPFYGRLASRFGARRLFLIGIAIFALGSTLSAIANGLETLLARTIQAIGGAAVPRARNDLGPVGPFRTSDVASCWALSAPRWASERRLALLEQASFPNSPTGDTSSPSAPSPL